MVKNTATLDEPKAMPFGYSEAINELVKIATVRKQDLDHLILLSTNELKQLRERLNRERSEFEQFKRADLVKHQDVIDVRYNKIIQRENELNMASEQMTKRSADLKTMEQKYQELLLERKKLDADRIEVERIRVMGHDISKTANENMSKAQGLMSSVSFKENEMNLKERKLNDLNAQLSIREGELKAREEKVGLEARNVAELKTLTDPKIKEIDAKVKEIEAAKLELAQKEIDLTKKIEESRAALRAIQEKEDRLNVREKEIMGAK